MNSKDEKAEERENKEAKRQEEKKEKEWGQGWGILEGHSCLCQVHSTPLWEATCVPGSLLNTGVQWSLEWMVPTFRKARSQIGTQTSST